MLKKVLAVMWTRFQRLQDGGAPRILRLSRDATLRVPPGRGVTVVRALQGTVLLTREGDGEDHVLEPGDELVFPRAGLAVIWALEESRIEVQRLPPGAAYAHRRGLREAEAA